MSVETRYARASDDTHVAYQVSGAGPIDIVFLRGWLPQVEHEWDEPVLARILRRLEAGARVIRFDRRGSGLSDRPPSALPTIEDRVDDLLAVLDAAGSSRAVFVGLGDGCLLLMVAAAAHPERCAGLVLYSPSARGSRAPDYPWQASQEEFEASLGRIRNLTRREMAERLVRLGAPSRTDDEALVAWFAEDLRRIGTTEEIVALRRLAYESAARWSRCTCQCWSWPGKGPLSMRPRRWPTRSLAPVSFHYPATTGSSSLAIPMHSSAR